MFDSSKAMLASTLLGAMRDVARMDALLDIRGHGNASRELTPMTASPPVRVAVTSVTSSSCNDDAVVKDENEEADEEAGGAEAAATPFATKEGEQESETAQIRSTLEAAALAPTLFAPCVREGRMPCDAVDRRRQFEMAAAVWNDLRARDRGR